MRFGIAVDAVSARIAIQKQMPDFNADASTDTAVTLRIARNSVFACKGWHMKVIDIGRELGIGYVREESVQRAEKKLRITVQLIEIANEAHPWAGKYDGALSGLFDLQDRIIMHVAMALQPSIHKATIQRTANKRTMTWGL